MAGHKRDRGILIELIGRLQYHGLLVAALSPPTGRVVTLSKLEETLLVNGQKFPLSANQYPGALSPQGFRFRFCSNDHRCRLSSLRR